MALLVGTAAAQDEPSQPRFADSHNDLARIEAIVEQQRQRALDQRKQRGALSSITRQASRDSALAKENAQLRAGPQLLDYADLSSRIGKQISITTFESRRHNGTIDAIDPGGVTLLVRQRGGYATFRIRKDRIREIEGY